MSKVINSTQSPALDFVEQELGSKIVTFFLTTGESIQVKELELIHFIEISGLNTHSESNGLICDPYATEIEVTVSPFKYLDSNFDEVTQAYFDQKLITVYKEAEVFMKSYLSKVSNPFDGQLIPRMIKQVEYLFNIKVEAA